MFSGGCVSSRYINNLQHYFENFEANASKFSQKYEQFFLTQYVTKTKRAEHRAMQSSFFLRSLLQNRKNTYQQLRYGTILAGLMILF